MINFEPYLERACQGRYGHERIFIQARITESGLLDLARDLAKRVAELEGDKLRLENHKKPPRDERPPSVGTV